MTDRTEIERLLQMTGQTLEGLPDTYPLDVRVHGILDIAKYEGLSPGAYKLIDRILHQSDVIELLVGALRDALDKPMQKPLTHKEAEELLQSGVRVWVEEYGYWEEPEGVNSGWLEEEGYGTEWRCWASRPTNEERKAAPWEV